MSKKKGETARVQSLFIAWKGRGFEGFWGSHNFQAIFSLPMKPGGGGGHKNITEPHGGMGESAKLHCDTPRILRPPISPPPSPPPPPRR